MSIGQHHINNAFVGCQTEELLKEINTEKKFGDVIGCCKWFNKKLGYGFITIYTGELNGNNIFVHHSGIQPLNSYFKTLKRGEYVSLNIIDGINGIQAIDVKGVCGGPLMCDNIDDKTRAFYKTPSPPKP